MSHAFRDTLQTAHSGGHWYDQSGARIDTVSSAKGLAIKPTVVHARKLQLAPGVTTILKTANREALNTYRESQILAAVKRCPQREGEPDSDWHARVLDASREHAESAAAVGSDLHEQIERELGDPTTQNPQVLAAAEALDTMVRGGRFGWANEVPAVSPFGYATRADLWHAGSRCLVDVKTKAGPLADQDIWPDHPLQLAATAAAVLPNIHPRDVRCAILFIRRDGVEARLVEVDSKDIERGWTCFRYLLAYWQERNRAKPSWSIPVTFN